MNVIVNCSHAFSELCPHMTISRAEGWYLLYDMLLPLHRAISFIAFTAKPHGSLLNILLVSKEL